MTSTARSKSQGKKKKGAKKPIEKSRKEIRKEQRKQKKAAKAEYFQKRKEQRSKEKSEPPAKTEQVEERKNEAVEAGKSKKPKKQLTKEKKEKVLKNKQVKRRKLLLEQENVKEDKLIKKLEKQLKLNKRKKQNIPKSFVADGLDYLLDFCVGETRKHAVDAEMQLAENEADTGFDEDLTMLVGGNETSNEDSDKDDQMSENEEDNDMDEEDNGEDMSSHQESDDDSSQETLKKKEVSKKRKIDNKLSTESLDSIESDGPEPDEDDISDDEDINEPEGQDEDDNGMWEDIYGRKRDEAGNVIKEVTKYVPPGARAESQNSGTNDGRYILLKRKLKGLINRLAEHNIHSIANEIDELYMLNSRNDMNDLLFKLMFEALVSPVLTPDRLVSEHMMLIAILHANVGTEVGAHFLETLIKTYHQMSSVPQEVENKEMDNLISMIAHLYNFKVYGYELLYQILERLLKQFTEKEIELILLILRTVGFPLRKDDPIALKEFILKVQQKASEEKIESSRVKFMLDVLLAIKNNNVNKIPQYDPSHVEHLKKIVRTVIRKGNAVTQFNVSLEDLLHADERGKWWVVGSAWTGSKDSNGQPTTSDAKRLSFGQDMLELARKQRMNTDTRRNIFCVLMTAEDYLDAFEKLHHLGLKNNQEREVIQVIMHCCLQEKNFNAYYAVLAQKFCEYDRKYQLTIQYTLWDKLKALDSYTSKQLCNLARFLTHLFIQKSLAFSILKVIQFAELEKQSMRLVRQIMLGTLLHEDEDACLQVFERIAVSPQLQNFRESLRLFINHFLIKKIDSKAPSEKEMLLKKRAEFVDKILTTKSARIIF